MIINRVNLGILIRMRREELGINQASLAEKCNISRSAMSAIEKGRSSTPLDKIIIITKFLNMNFIENDIILRETNGVTVQDYNIVKNSHINQSIKELVDNITRTNHLKSSQVFIYDGKLTINIDIAEIISSTLKNGKDN